MIFLTVGTQLPFDRLVATVDAWLESHATTRTFAQIGESPYRPNHMEWANFLTATQFREHVSAANVIVSHAGIGSLLMSLMARKPMIVMPRQAALNEIRNDHQLATVKWLRELPGITVVDDEDGLATALSRRDWQQPDEMPRTASPKLLAAVRDFIERD
ncbi:MAG: hypothetical protein JO001_12020 [Alphaproteobacteria bacterium]|nr:hypothetical protein [Alphaproteobacteria bacterium]